MSAIEEILVFKNQSFTFQEFQKRTEFSKTYARGILAEMVKRGILQRKRSKRDKRRRAYQLHWPAVRQLLIDNHNFRQKFLYSLNLSKYEGQYVALSNFEVIDADDKLEALFRRVYAKGVSSDTLVLPVGRPKRGIICEFS